MLVIRTKNTARSVENSFLVYKPFRFTNRVHSFTLVSEMSNTEYELSFVDADTICDYYTIVIGSGTGMLNLSNIPDGIYRFAIDDCSCGNLYLNVDYTEKQIDETTYDIPQTNIFYDCE